MAFRRVWDLGLVVYTKYSPSSTDRGCFRAEMQNRKRMSTKGCVHGVTALESSCSGIYFCPSKAASRKYTTIPVPP